MPKIAQPMGRRIQKHGYPQAVQQLKLQARRLLGLSDDVAVSVSELSCREPGCPDVETVIAVLNEGESPRIARVHRSIPDVTLDDLKAAFDLTLRT